MTHEENKFPPVDEPPIVEAPDPSGPPEPVKKNAPMLGIIATVGVGTVALGGLLIPAFLNTGRTCGATRSAKIQWEQRQRQIEQVIQEDQAARAAETAGPAREVPGNDGHTR